MKKTRTTLFRVLCLAIPLCLLAACKKDGSNGGKKPSATVPTLSTAAPGGATETTAQSGGTVTDDGGAAVTARGVVWGTSPNPTTADAKTSDGTGTGAFTSTMTGLTAGTGYYVRAYATNSAGTAYGNQLGVQAARHYTVPTVVIDVASAYSDGAVIEGNVTADGSSGPGDATPITARGICWGTAQNPTTSDSKTVDNGSAAVGKFVGTLSGLAVNTRYYARAYATNKVGTAYSEQVDFTTAYAVGQNFGGGKIFYIDATKIHGLVVSPEDLSSNGVWDGSANAFTVSPGAYSATDGAGNTAKIYKTFGGDGNAAALCKEYRGGGFSDWFLPAANQLVLIQSRAAVLYPQTTLPGAFLPAYYWSSTESSTYTPNAYAVHLNSGEANGSGFKTDRHPVRAVRAF